MQVASFLTYLYHDKVNVTYRIKRQGTNQNCKKILVVFVQATMVQGIINNLEKTEKGGKTNVFLYAAALTSKQV